MTDAEVVRKRLCALIVRVSVAMLMNVDEKGTHIGRLDDNCAPISRP